MMKKLLLGTALLFTMIFLQAQNNTTASPLPSPYEPRVLKAFADSLYDEGFLSQAEGEYKRLLFAEPGLQEPLLALTNIYKKQQSLSGIQWLKSNFYDGASIPVKENINFVQAQLLFKEGDAQNFNLFSNSILAERIDFSPRLKNLIDVSELLLNQDIGGLRAFTLGLAANYPNYEKLSQLCSSYKQKSPGLALFLSAIIPGSGKWYTGSFGAFSSSFLAIGSFVAGTIMTGIQSQWKSWQPYVFGVCGAVLYIAELYGSYQSAKRYNTALYRVLCEETEKLYEVEY